MFLGLFAGVLSSRFKCLLIARGGCGWSLVIRLPWLGITLVFCRGLSTCLGGAAVPLGSSVLRWSWSSRWSLLSQVGTVFFLGPRS